MTNTEFSKLCLALKCPPEDIGHVIIYMSDSDTNFLHGAIGACGEAGELLDIAKKRLVYGEKIDIVHAKEEVGDILHYLTYVCNALNMTFEQCMGANIRKLRQRYPQNFSKIDALNRDLEKERKELENDS